MHVQAVCGSPWGHPDRGSIVNTRMLAQAREAVAKADRVLDRMATHRAGGADWTPKQRVEFALLLHEAGVLTEEDVRIVEREAGGMVECEHCNGSGWVLAAPKG